MIGYLPDAGVVAGTLTLKADRLAGFDREHLVWNPRVGELPFPIGTVGDFLVWYRERRASSG